jgi:hypothetical protein
VLPKLYNGKNRTFFFFSYEGMRLRQNTTGSASVPTEAQRQGDFSGLLDSNGRRYVLYDPMSVAQTGPNTFTKTPFLNNQIPVNRESPLAKYLNSITQLPTLPGVNPLNGSNWYGPISNTTDQYTITAKGDHRLTERDQRVHSCGGASDPIDRPDRANERERDSGSPNRSHPRGW